jgi:hypothetical protein
VCRPRVWVGWGSKVHQAKALPSLVDADNVDTFGVDPLVEGVVMVAWGTLGGLPVVESFVMVVYIRCGVVSIVFKSSFLIARWMLDVLGG